MEETTVTNEEIGVAANDLRFPEEEKKKLNRTMVEGV